MHRGILAIVTLVQLAHVAGAAPASDSAVGLGPCCGGLLGAGLVGGGLLGGGYDPFLHDRAASKLVERRREPGVAWVSRRPPADGSGRVWSGGTVTGGTAPTAAWPGSGRPGASVGAPAEEDRLVVLRDGDLLVAIEPFVRLPEESQQKFEIERQRWLRRHGYTGGVRTFVKPGAAVVDTGERPAEATPTPRAIFRVPAQPRIESPAGKQEVRLSLPPAMVGLTGGAAIAAKP